MENKPTDKITAVETDARKIYKEWIQTFPALYLSEKLPNYVY